MVREDAQYFPPSPTLKDEELDDPPFDDRASAEYIRMEHQPSTVNARRDRGPRLQRAPFRTEAGSTYSDHFNSSRYAAKPPSAFPLPRRDSGGNNAGRAAHEEGTTRPPSSLSRVSLDFFDPIGVGQLQRRLSQIPRGLAATEDRSITPTPNEQGAVVDIRTELGTALRRTSSSSGSSYSADQPATHSELNVDPKFEHTKRADSFDFQATLKAAIAQYVFDSSCCSRLPADRSKS